jgi:hypothetical protein
MFAIGIQAAPPGFSYDWISKIENRKIEEPWSDSTIIRRWPLFATSSFSMTDMTAAATAFPKLPKRKAVTRELGTCLFSILSRL